MRRVRHAVAEIVLDGASACSGVGKKFFCGLLSCTTQIAVHKENDPAILDELEAKVRVAKQAADRWTGESSPRGMRRGDSVTRP